MRSDYKRLGDYIREVDVRNRDLAVTNLLGLSMTKQFRPSTSNVIGVDLSRYKVVDKNVFAFDPMSVIRVHKVPIALNVTDAPIIVSPAYTTFESRDVNSLDPRYLMMWFQRSEFDRYADFKSDSAVRGGYDWNELCDTMVCIPSISRQRELVTRYETLTRRICLNETLITDLEVTAQTLYRHLFVDNIDPENLPAGWRMGTIGEICLDTLGGDWGKESPEGNYNTEVLCFRGADIPKGNIGRIDNVPLRYILKKNLANRNLNAGEIVIEISGGSPTQSTGRALYISDSLLKITKYPFICSNFCRKIKCMDNYSQYIHATIKYLYNNDVLFKYENSSNGVKNLDLASLFVDERIVVPKDDDALRHFNELYDSLLKYIVNLGQANSSLEKMQNLLLTQLAK